MKHNTHVPEYAIDSCCFVVFVLILILAFSLSPLWHSIVIIIIIIINNCRYVVVMMPVVCCVVAHVLSVQSSSYSVRARSLRVCSSPPLSTSLSCSC